MILTPQYRIGNKFACDILDNDSHKVLGTLIIKDDFFRRKLRFEYDETYILKFVKKDKTDIFQ